MGYSERPVDPWVVLAVADSSLFCCNVNTSISGVTF